MTLWAKRMGSGPAEALMAFTASLAFDQRLAPDDRPRLGRARAGPRAGGDPHAGRGGGAARCPAGGPSGGLRRGVRLPPRRRGRPHRDRAAGHGAGRGDRGEAPHRAAAATTRSRRRYASSRAGALGEVARDVLELQEVPLGSGAARRATLYLPGYTHLQRAQPVLLAHHLLAHGWALARDFDRMLDDPRADGRVPARRRRARRVLAPPRPRRRRRGARLRVALRELARRRERSRLRRGDPVRPGAPRRPPLAHRRGDRRCSRPRSSASYHLDDAWATGSSMLPQKKNPDVAELARGKAGRLIGHLPGFLDDAEGPPTLLQPGPARGQGAPLRCAWTRSCLALAALDGLFATAVFDDERMRAAADEPASPRSTSPSGSSPRGCPSARRTASSARSSGRSVERGRAARRARRGPSGPRAGRGRAPRRRARPRGGARRPGGRGRTPSPSSSSAFASASAADAARARRARGVTAHLRRRATWSGDGERSVPDRSFFDRRPGRGGAGAAQQAARDVGALVGRIVEVEAYRGGLDAGEPRLPGTEDEERDDVRAPRAPYVYFTYGMHFCANVVCGPGARPRRVLLRALAPLAGCGADAEPRASGRPAASGRDSVLGPGRLCQAFGIDRSLDGARSRQRRQTESSCSTTGPRRLRRRRSADAVGLSSTCRGGGDWPWRFASTG